MRALPAQNFNHVNPFRYASGYGLLPALDASWNFAQMLAPQLTIGKTVIYNPTASQIQGQHSGTSASTNP